jgi:hypothetical protein
VFPVFHACPASSTWFAGDPCSGLPCVNVVRPDAPPGDGGGRGRLGKCADQRRLDATHTAFPKASRRTASVRSLGGIWNAREGEAAMAASKRGRLMATSPTATPDHPPAASHQILVILSDGSAGQSGARVGHCIPAHETRLRIRP